MATKTPDPLELAGERILKALDLSSFVALNEILTADTLRCAEEIRRQTNEKQPPEPFWVRLFVKSFFSHIEGNLYQLRQLVLRAHSLRLVHLSPEEVSDLSEEKRFLELQKGLRITHETFARLYDFSLALDFAGEDWRLFGMSIKIRNRLMHPKQSSDLDITDREVINLIRSNNWYLGMMRQLAESARGRFSDSRFVQGLILTALRSSPYSPDSRAAASISRRDRK